MTNQANLEATLAAIEAHPEHWNQGAWHCGTSHCFAGFAEMLRLGKSPTEECHEAKLPDENKKAALVDQQATREWLGISETAWECITDEFNTLETIHDMVHSGDTSEWPGLVIEYDDEDWDEDQPCSRSQPSATAKP